MRSSMGESSAWLASRLVYVETMRAIGLSRGPESPEVRRLSSEWSSFDVIELEHELAERAVALAIDHGLRSLDAIHLAAALTPETGDVTMATYDDRLWDAARVSGLEVLPKARPSLARR